MKLFQKMGAALPGAKKLVSGLLDESQPPVEEDQGGFGPPGGVLWTTPLDVLSDRPKAGLPTQSAINAPLPEPAPALPPGSPDRSEALERTGLLSTDIEATSEIGGFIGACLVDSGSGLVLAETGDGRIDMEAAAALNTQIVRAEHEVIEVLDLDDHIEDILITMGKQLHFIRPLEKSPGVFLYVALDKKQANLGMARMQVGRIESTLKM